jgi:hypothetical protein
LPALSLTSVLVDLIDFFSDFFSAFLSGLAMLKVKVGGSVGVGKIKFGDGRALRQRGPYLPNWHVSSSCHHSPRPLAMSESEGNFDVIILGTGLVESIAAA